MRRNELTDAFAPHWAGVISGLVAAAGSAYAANKQKQGAMAQAAGAAQPQGASPGSFGTTASSIQGSRAGGGGLAEALGGAGAPPPQAADRGLGDVMRQEESRFSPAGQAPTPDEAKKDIQVAGSAGVTPAVAGVPASSGTAPKAEGSNLGPYANLASTGAGLADALSGPRPPTIAPVSPGSMNFQSSLQNLRRRRGVR